jgi:hypothetical protein
MKFILGLTLTVGWLIAIPHVALHAESRGAPWSEEQLLKKSTIVFVGEVLETTTFNQYKRTVPTRVRVLLSVKGNVPQGERAVRPKHPGNFVYFDQEFSQAEKGRLGLFFVGAKEQPDLLMGYKQIPNKQR